jgi:pimeloyl-ACP methyl ester carboxylesterase
MKQLLFSITLIISILSCGKDSTELTPQPIVTTPEPIVIPKVVPPVPDTSFRPIVMIHGFLASGDTYTSFAQRFTSNGYSWRKIFVFDWNSLGQGANVGNDLDKFIDNVLQKTGYTQVELMGHSAGGGTGYSYLKDAKRAAKVAHYVHIGAAKQDMPAGPTGNVPTLNLWSDGDKIAQGGDIPNATNAKIPKKDHYQIATSPESFKEAYRFFKNEDPKTTDILAEATPCIGGRALSFGENQPAVGASVKIYEVDKQTGERLRTEPDFTFTTDALGFWGNTLVKPNVNYELVVQEKEAGKRAIHYYREGFTHNNLLTYLRVLPPASSLAGLLLNGLPTTTDQTVLNVFCSSQAAFAGRDSMKVDNNLVTTTQIAPESKTMIALFVYDANANKKTDLSTIGTFSSFSFLSGVDMFLDVSKTAPIEVVFNKRRLAIKRWKASENVVVSVFD